MDQLCGVVDYLKDQVRTEEPKIYPCESRRSKEVCAICMMDQHEVALTFEEEAGEAGRVNGLTYVAEEMLEICSQCDHRVHKTCHQLIY